jgi:crotonobetainyl-CoA:carnitine CoA-transferase CaiB-like acyl-CoA transferase
MALLDALHVVEIGDLGEVAGKLLADAGADVVKVEPPGGAKSRRAGPFAGDRFDLDASLTYAYWNTSKRGVTLDPATPDGLDLWRRLVERADAVIDAAGPGVLDAAGAGHDAFAADERLVWCSITPFGRDGPWRDLAVNDLVSIALGGPMMSTGYDDHDLPPIRPEGGHSLALAGEFAVIGLLTALWQRDATGLGQLLDVSIHEAVSCTTEGAFPNWEYARRISQRQTGRHANPNATAPWQIRCRDGRHVVLMGGGIPRDERVWESLLAWMDETGAGGPIRDPRFQSGPRTPEERQLIFDTLHRFVESLDAETAYRRGQASHMPWGFVRRPEENLADPHWHDRGFFLKGEVPGHAGDVLYPGAPYLFSETPLAWRRRAPLLGEHNYEVYVGELGLAPEHLLVLAGAGVI